MSMAEGSKKHQEAESPIFDEISLYKIVETNKGRTVMLHYDGSVSMILEFSGINNTSMTEYDFETMFKRIQNTLDDTRNPSISMQFIMTRTNNVSQDENHFEHLPSYLKPRAEYLESLSKNYELFENKFYVSIYYQAHTGAEKKEGLFTKAYNKYIKRSETEKSKLNKNMTSVQDRLVDVTELGDSLMQMFQDIGARYRILQTKQDYYEVLEQFTRPNKSRIENLEIEDREESPRQVLFSGVRAKVRRKDFTLDDYFHKVYMLDRAPRSEIYGPSIEVIENVPFEFIYSVTFRVMTHNEAINTFKFKLAEKRMATGANENSLIEDRSLMAEEKRVSDSYDMFAFGEGVGLNVSVNFVLRMKESHLEKMQQRYKASRSETIRRLDQMLSKRVFSSFGSSEWINEESTGWVVFANLIPGMSSMHKSTLKNLFLTTENIPYFFAMYDNKRNIEHNGTNHFVDQRGNLVTFDLMDPTLPAWNYSISGQTGSGKSVLMNAILTMQFADVHKSGKKPVICILDVGGDRGSYSKFMKLVQGTEINLSGARKPSIQMFEIIPERSLPVPQKVEDLAVIMKRQKLKKVKESELENRVRTFFETKIGMRPEDVANDFEMRQMFQDVFEIDTDEEGKKIWADVKEAFDLQPGECKPGPQKFTQIMGILEVMLSTSAKRLDAFANYDYDEISEIVSETYNRVEGRHARLSDFYDTCKDMVSQDEPKGRKLLTKIKNYTAKHGQYPMFDQDTKLDISNDVILADLKGLESEPQLQIIYTLLLSQMFNDKMYFTRDRRKLMVRDEAWSLMKNERARQFFVEDLRTARKNGFATVSISQLPTDYLSPDPQLGRGIISNMQVNIFCKFSTESICREVGQEYGLNEKIVQEMKTLGVQKQIQEDGSFKATYAKFMMLIPNAETGNTSVYVLKNLLHPFEYALYSSSAEDNAVIDYYMVKTKQYEHLEDVLWLMAQNKHVGDMGLATFLEEAGYKNQARKVRGAAGAAR